MSKEIWDEHNLLYHYTTSAGLKGILESQTLHATHFGFMNDSTEIYQMKPRLVETASQIVTKLREGDVPHALDKAARDTLSENAASDASRIVDHLYGEMLGLDGRAKLLQPFVVSFCGHDS